ncbi:MAG: SMI1/KNR4 family protein [Gammaproteobacteria bacterium]|nr:SMI1/KNR4 family protein [Gammaproteobacteria bacterium]
MKVIKYEYFISHSLLPKEFIYPADYKLFVDQEKPYEIDFRPWDFYCSMLDAHFRGLNKRYPDKVLIPFAQRIDNDDVACFDGAENTGNPRVLIIHDFTSPGWENRGILNNFTEWLHLAKEESKEWKEFHKNKYGMNPE